MFCMLTGRDWTKRLFVVEYRTLKIIFPQLCACLVYKQCIPVIH